MQLKLTNPLSKGKLINAETTLGMDDSAFALRFKNNPKAVPIKAIFGKKHIKFKKPLLQWEQNIQKIK
jgi:hypothetical protein